MLTISKYRCPVCKISDWQKLFSTLDKTSQCSFSFYQCKSCGLIKLDPFPEKSVTEKLYAYTNPEIHNQISSPIMKLVYMIPGGKYLISSYVRSAHILRQKVVLQYLASGKLLDVGCGTGEFLTLFDSHFWNLNGVEINHHLTQTIRINYPKIKIFSKTLETFYPKSKYDIITLWHVFEHLPDPLVVIKKCKRLLNDGGWLIIEIPQANSLTRKLFGPYWNLLLIPQHLFFWTASSLTLILKTGGFDVIQIRFCGIVSSFPSSAGNWLRSHRIPSFLSTIAGFLFYPLILLLYLILPRTRDNLIIIAQKPK